MAAALELPEPKSATWRELAGLSKVGQKVARVTCWDMVRAGELEVCGYVLPDGGKGRPVALFRPAPKPDVQQGGAGAVACVMAAWLRSY